MISRLNDVIRRRGLTKRELARLVGVSEDTIGRAARDDGIGRLTLGKLERLAHALGCGVKDLFEG